MNIFFIKRNITQPLNQALLFENKQVKLLQKQYIKTIKSDTTKFNLFLKQIKKNKIIMESYTKYINKFFFYKKYKYFKRVNKIFFSIFSKKNIDTQLLVNAIAYEFKKLKRGHIFLFRFFKTLLSYFYKNQIKKIKGLSLIIKGRIILKNRQTPRKKKFTLTLGKSNKSTLYSFLKQNNAISIGKLGIINIKLTITLSKITYTNKLYKQKMYKNLPSTLISYINYRLYLKKNLSFSQNFKITHQSIRIKK